MRFESPRVIGVIASGLVLAGWLLGSTLSPPVALTQERTGARPAAPPRPLPSIEPLRSFDATALRANPPTPTRNPFAFGHGAAIAAAAPADAPVRPPADETAPDLALPAPPPSWRLVGVAVDASGVVTAVLNGAGDVHLARSGDRLPGDLLVTDVTDATVRLQRPDGSEVTLRLP